MSEDAPKEKSKKGLDDDAPTEEFDFDVSKGPFGDVVKKLFAAGTSAAFLTEEGIRAYLGDIKLPKEMLNRILQGATKSKEEITGRVCREIISIVKRIDFVKEASRFVEEHKFRITAEIEVARKDDKKSSDSKPSS